MTEVLTLVRAVRTCLACPSQWDAWDADGNYYYLRYRSACGEVRQYLTEDWSEVTEDQFVQTIATFEYGDHPLDGSISLEDFAREAGIRLAPGLMETSFGDYLRDELILGGTIGTEYLEQG